MEKAVFGQPFLLVFIRSEACKGCAAFNCLFIVRRSSGALRNPVGVTDNKQAVSSPADNMDDIPIGTP